MCLSWASSTRAAMPIAGRVDEHVEAAVALDVLGDHACAVLRVETSAATASAPSSAAAASTFSAVRDASVSANPSSPSIRAIARPIPDEPPVTSADAQLQPSGDYLRNVPKGTGAATPKPGAERQTPPLP